MKPKYKRILLKLSGESLSGVNKHGIDFASAAGVFADTDAIIELNSFDEYTSEERFDIIGLVLGHLMFVVYVERLSKTPEYNQDHICQKSNKNGENTIC